VWLAQNVMGTWRAVKIVRREGFESDRPYEREFTGIKRFEPVSRSQDSQVDVLHVGRNDRAGYFYYVMELADDVHTGQQIDATNYEARTLRSEMEHRGRFSVSRCLTAGIALCGALEHLHANGLVHRDVKPSNIIFVHGRPKLADIGLVAGFDETVSFVGTEGFVPPEGPGTPQADLFSLGKVLYELHTGFDRKSFPELPADSTSDGDSNFGQELNLIILKACSPAAHSRHRAVRELREELQLLQSGRSIRRLRQAENRAVFFRRFGLVAGVIAAIALIGYVAALKANRRADANAREAKDELLKARYSQARSVRLSGQAGRSPPSVKPLPSRLRASCATKRLPPSR
jgi:eukaryotic-like serine/threonine-protein kinase